MNLERKSTKEDALYASVGIDPSLVEDRLFGEGCNHLVRLVKANSKMDGANGQIQLRIDEEHERITRAMFFKSKTSEPVHSNEWLVKIARKQLMTIGDRFREIRIMPQKPGRFMRNQFTQTEELYPSMDTAETEVVENDRRAYALLQQRITGRHPTANMFQDSALRDQIEPVIEEFRTGLRTRGLYLDFVGKLPEDRNEETPVTTNFIVEDDTNRLVCIDPEIQHRLSILHPSTFRVLGLLQRNVHAFEELGYSVT